MFSGVGGVKIFTFLFWLFGFGFAFKFFSSLLQLKKEQNRENRVDGTEYIDPLGIEYFST